MVKGAPMGAPFLLCALCCRWHADCESLSRCRRSNRWRKDRTEMMLANDSATLKGSALLQKDWLDLKADLARWTRAERILAGLFGCSVAVLMPFLVALGQG